jgi:hypothetical protein
MTGPDGENVFYVFRVAQMRDPGVRRNRLAVSHGSISYQRDDEDGRTPT